MSYEPTLIIKKSDLQEHQAELETYYLQKEGSMKREVYEFLYRILQNKYPPVIDGIELLLCTPELTSFNELIRKQLHDWDVQFSIDY